MLSTRSLRSHSIKLLIEHQLALRVFAVAQNLVKVQWRKRKWDFSTSIDRLAEFVRVSLPQTGERLRSCVEKNLAIVEGEAR